MSGESSFLCALVPPGSIEAGCRFRSRCGYAVPAYRAGPRVYSDRAMVVVLRQRPTGQVAWSARLGSDALGSHRLTQDRVQDLTRKIFEGLK